MVDPAVVERHLCRAVGAEVVDAAPAQVGDVVADRAVRYRRRRIAIVAVVGETPADRQGTTASGSPAVVVDHAIAQRQVCMTRIAVVEDATATAELGGSTVSASRVAAELGDADPHGRVAVLAVIL